MISVTCSNEEIIRIVEEAIFMSSLSHPLLLPLVGVTIDDLGLPWIITPYMANHDLQTYLRKFRYDEELHDKVKSSSLPH